MIHRMRLFAALAAVAMVPGAQADDVVALKSGTPELKSAGALAFGPDGVLFVADAPASTIYAIATEDTKPAAPKDLKIEKLDEAIAAVVGVTAADVIVNDMKVSPASGAVYMSVSRGKAPGAGAAIVKIGADGKPTAFNLKNVKFASTKLPNTGKGQSITSMAFHKGELYVAGLTTEEWASNLRAIPFPFPAEAGKGTGVQIYHGAHGAWETRAPIQTFMAYDIAGQTHLLASYVCTPLVKFPIDDIKKGDKVKGKTVAELGNRNRPLDIIAYKKDGKDFALIANSARGIMKVALEGVDKIDEITTRVNGTSGLKYESVEAMKDVVQLDKASDTQAVVVKKSTSGMSIELVTLP